MSAADLSGRPSTLDQGLARWGRSSSPEDVAAIGVVSVPGDHLTLELAHSFPILFCSTRLADIGPSNRGEPAQGENRA